MPMTADRRLQTKKTTRHTNLTTGGPVHVDVADGRIVRIIPLQLDDSDGPSWTLEARGRRFTPPRRTALAPQAAGPKSPIHSANVLSVKTTRLPQDHKTPPRPLLKGDPTS
jgi:hypothetical protein